MIELTPTTMYWLITLPKILDSAELNMLIFMGYLVSIAFFVSTAMTAVTGKHPPYAKHFKLSCFIFIPFTVFVISFISLRCAIPSFKDLAIIYGVPKAIELAKPMEAGAKRIPPKVLELIEKNLDVAIEKVGE